MSDWEDEADTMLASADIGGNWDDEDEDLALKEAEAAAEQEKAALMAGTAPSAQAPAPKKKLTKRELAEKKRREREEREVAERRARAKVAADAEEEANLDPTALKMKRRQQVEEADHELTQDLFADVMGGGKAPAKKDAAGPGEKLKAAVAAYEIGSDEDLVQMGETLANSLAEALSGTEVRDLMTHILTFLKEGSALDADALKEVQSKCNVLRNEVLKDQRAADKKKKSKKKAVKTMRNDDWMEGAGRYEDFGDDYGDFM